MTTVRKTDEENIHSQDHHLDTGTEESLVGDLLHEKKVEETEIYQTEKGVDDSCVTVELMSDIAGSGTVEFGIIKNEDCQVENSSDADDGKVQLQTSFTEPDPLPQDISEVENYMSEKCCGLIEDDAGVEDNEPEEQEKFQGQETSETVEKEGTEEKFASADSSLSDFHAGNEDGNENERISKEEDEMEMSHDGDSKHEDERSDLMEDDIGVADNEPGEREKFQGQETSQTAEKEATEETYDASADSSLSAFHAGNENGNENEKISNEEEEKEFSCDEDSKQEDERTVKESMNNCLTASDDGLNADDTEKMLNCTDSEGQKSIGAECDAIGGYTHGTIDADNFRTDDEIDEQLHSRKEVESERQYQTASTLFVSFLKSEEMCVQGDEFEKSSHCSHEQSSQEDLDEGSKRDEICRDNAPISKSAKAEMNDQSNTHYDTTYSDTDDKLTRETYETEGSQMNGKINEQHQHQKPVLSVHSCHPCTQEQMQQKEGEQQDLMEKQDETNLCSTDVPTLALRKLERDISPSTMLPVETEATLLIKQQKNSDNPRSKEDRKDHDSRSEELAADENVGHGFSKSCLQVQNHKRAIPPFAKFDDHILSECNGTDLCHHGASHFINNKNNESPDVQQSAHVDVTKIASFESKSSQPLNQHIVKQQQDDSVNAITSFDVKDSEEYSDPAALVESFVRKRYFINNPEQDGRSEANQRDAHEFKGDQSDTLQPVSSESSSPVGGLLLQQSSPGDAAISTAIFKHQQERDIAQEGNRMDAEMGDECEKARTKKSAAQQGSAVVRKPSNDAKPKRRRWIQCICCMCVT